MKAFPSLYCVLSKERKKEFLLLQFIVVISALFEVLSISMIAPFLGGVADSKIIENNSLLNFAYHFLSATSYSNFILKFGLFIILLIALSSLISILTIKKLSYFAASVGSDLGDLLYSFYIKRNYQAHLTYSEAHLTKQIAVEVARVTDNILQPIVQINARIIVVCVVSTGVIIYEPFIALLAFFIISLGYGFIFLYVKNKLKTNGEIITFASKSRFHLLGVAFGAFKDIKVLGVEDFFIDRFKINSKRFALAYGGSNTLYNIPRYIMELVVFVSLILSIVFLVIFSDRNISDVIPSLAILGVAALKLLPSFQQIYSGLAQVRSHLSALNSIIPDVKDADEYFCHSQNYAEKKEKIKIKESIKLKNVSLIYDGQSNYALKDISFSIKKNEKFGIIGESGSGKSTILDILLGLKIPTCGEVWVDNRKITAGSKEWQRSVGLVSQNIFIINGSVRENIAFGSTDIDEEMLNRVIKLASLDRWIAKLPSFLDTHIGDDGVQLSGGQRQRIGIARALYNDPEIIFLDEATSALDIETEKEILASLNEIAKEKTVVMIAHRLNTLEACDRILELRDGVVVSLNNRR